MFCFLLSSIVTSQWSLIVPNTPIHSIILYCVLACSPPRWSFPTLGSPRDLRSLTGVWVLAHECGHQSFSPSKTVNYWVGWVLHSALLVPFHSWRITHAQHHASTSHMARDQAFVPYTRSQLNLPSLPADASKREVEGALPPSLSVFSLICLSCWPR